MRITKIKPRKDGRYLVSLTFATGKTLRKLVSNLELENLRKQHDPSTPAFKTPFDT